jgi:methionyl aminopeptidase
MNEVSAKLSIFKDGGQKLAFILKALLKGAHPGVKTSDLEKLAEVMIKEAGGHPSFKTVRGYKYSTCMCVNDEVVHGIPDDILKEGDILCIDVGLLYKEYHTDTAWTIRIQNSQFRIQNLKDKEIDRFLKTGEETLYKAIKEARVGNRIGHISKVIQDNIEGAGYSVVRSLIGHGVGKQLHEEPQIPGILTGDINNTPIIKEGMTLAIEVIYNQGSPDVVYKNNDGWTISTKDGSLSAVFEHTVGVTEEGPVILTKA